MSKFLRMTLPNLLEYLDIQSEETTASTYLYIAVDGKLTAIEKFDRTSFPVDEDTSLGYAWMWLTEETLTELARRTGINLRTLSMRAKDGTLTARKSAGVWLSTVEAVERAIHYGHIRASKKHREINAEKQAADNTIEHREKRFPTI